MSDLRHPIDRGPDGAEAIDPDSPDFVSQFDREFGSPQVETPEVETGQEAPSAFVGEPSTDDGGASAAGATAVLPKRERARRDPADRSLPERIAYRIIRRPYEWAKRPWPDDRVIQVATTIACLVVTTYIMMQVLHWNPLSSSADLVNDDATPTGGDMGAHVWGPAFLRDHLLPNGQLSGWSMDWYGGLPVYRFYMVIPALMITALDAILPYGVAFKYVVIVGLVTLPFCCWAFGRLARFRYPIPELFAFAGVCFALNESYAIYGGNVKSTMAGEFSFSIAISLMVLGWGLLARGLDEGKYRSWAAIVLGLACLSHGIVLIYTIVGAIVIVGCRLFADLWRRNGPNDRLAMTIFLRRLWYATCVGVLTLLLFAFWVGPFLFNHDYMTDMKYGSRPEGASDSFWDMLFDQFVAFDLIINTLAVVGLVFCVLRRHVYGIALGLTGLIAVALVYLTRDSLPVIGLLWNPRVLPLLYFVRFFMMMVGLVEVFGLAVNLIRNRPPRETMSTGFQALSLGAGALAVLIIFGWSFQVLPFGGHRVVHGQSQYAWGPFRGSHGAEGNGDARSDGWSRYNFLGYEDRELYPEYYNVVQEMDRIGREQGCGRALWENNGRNEDGNGRYGTTMALMLLPHWTDGCIGSMEGLFFEASGTTPYMFLAAGAASRQSSNPGPRAALREQRRCGGGRLPPGARRALPHGPHERGGHRGRSSAGVDQARRVGAVADLPGRRLGHRGSARRSAGGGEWSGGRSTRAVPRAGHVVVPEPGGMGGDAGRRRPGRLAAHRRRGRHEPGDPRSDAADRDRRRPEHPRRGRVRGYPWPPSEHRQTRAGHRRRGARRGRGQQRRHRAAVGRVRRLAGRRAGARAGELLPELGSVRGRRSVSDRPEPDGRRPDRHPCQAHVRADEL